MEKSFNNQVKHHASGSLAQNLNKCETYQSNQTWHRDKTQNHINYKSDFHYSKKYTQAKLKKHKKSKNPIYEQTLVDPSLCTKTHRQITADSHDLTSVIEQMKTFVNSLSLECMGQGPQMLCGDQDNAKWMKLREIRVTASRFGDVAKRRSLEPPEGMIKFVGNNVSPKTYDNSVASLDYGKVTEKIAIKAYQDKYPNIQVKQTGVWSHSEFPWMGGSPDGLIYDRSIEEEGLLEVKCPLKGQICNFQEVATQNGFYMNKGINGKYSLNKSHKYYYQIQGCMNIINREFCDFVIYTSKDIYVERIVRDKEFFKTMKGKLREYYYRFELPYHADKPKPKDYNIEYTFISKDVYDTFLC